MRIYDAQVNHLTNPLGFAMDGTVFNWKAADAKGKKQQAARVVVSSDEAMTKVLTDTGWQEDAQSLGWRVDVALKPRTRYWWQVSVRDDAGDEGVSAPQWFETGKMDEPWEGKWIGCDDGESRHPIFSKAFPIEGEVASARLYISGLGLYEAFIGADGGETERVGDEYLTPYCNDYDKWVQCQTYDVTNVLKHGEENALIEVMLGNGWYKGRYGWQRLGDAGFYGDSWKLIAELRISYKDGGESVIGTDGSWRVRRSNITFSNIYDGEHRDDTLSEVADENVALCAPPAGALCDRHSLPVKIQKTLNPVSLIRTPAGESVFDIGQEITGIFELKVDLPRGCKVRIQTGEILQGGNFYNANLRTAKSEYLYTSGGSPAVIKPHFTFYGFRYVKVEGIENLKTDDFAAFALWSDFADKGTVSTGHPLVNKFIQNVRWGLRDNFVDVPTDCPQRDERMGWTGDAQVFTNTACYLVDTYAFYSKFLYDMSREQEDLDGGVPIVVPSAGYSGVASVWSDAACIMPWNIYTFYGDASILEKQYSSMKSWVDYVRRLDGDDHAWRKHFHFGDWLALDNPAGGAEQMLGGTDEGFIASVYFAASAQILSKAAKVLGKDGDAAEYERLAKEQFDDVRREYCTATGRPAINTQAALILTLKYHLSDNAALVKAMLKKLFEYTGMKLRTGFVGTPLLCNVLTENGMEDIAYALLMNEDYPGWLHEVKLGATTVWERWNSLLDDGTISGINMNSMNHYSYGSVLEWIFRYVAGLNFTEDVPGCRRAVIRPLVSRALYCVDARYDSPAGLWRVSWQTTDFGCVTLRVTVPFGCTACLTLPGADKEVKELETGEYKYTTFDI